jgi:hypothetical protein
MVRSNGYFMNESFLELELRMLEELCFKVRKTSYKILSDYVQIFKRLQLSF